MISILKQEPRPGDSRMTRREVLRIGGLSGLGLSSIDLALLRARGSDSGHREKYRKNSCVFIFLFGGPSHIDLWDMKPSRPWRSVESSSRSPPKCRASSFANICR